MMHDNIELLEQQNQALGRRVRRLKWLAFTGWVGCVLAVAGGIVVWWVMDRNYQSTRSQFEIEDKHLEERVSLQQYYFRNQMESLLANNRLHELTTIVEVLGGRVEEDRGQVVTVDLSNTNTTDAHLKKLLRLFEPGSPKSLNLRGTRVTEDAVKRLKEKNPGLKIIR